MPELVIKEPAYMYAGNGKAFYVQKCSGLVWYLSNYISIFYKPVPVLVNEYSWKYMIPKMWGSDSLVILDKMLSTDQAIHFIIVWFALLLTDIIAYQASTIEFRRTSGEIFSMALFALWICVIVTKQSSSPLSPLIWKSSFAWRQILISFRGKSHSGKGTVHRWESAE